MNTKDKDIIVFILFLMLTIVWMFHIPYSISPNVVEAFFTSYDTPRQIVLRNVGSFAIFVSCLLIFAGKKILDSKWQQYKFYRICATFIANIAFIFAWLISLTLNNCLYCDYYWSASCKDNIEGYPCNDFPIEIDIAYLLHGIPMFFMFIIMLYFAFCNKTLNRSNCLWLSWLPFFTLIYILLHVGINGAGCYD